MSGHTVPFTIGGRTVAALDEAATALLVALHAAHHGTERPSALRDIDQAVDRFDLEVWKEAHLLANRLCGVERFAAGLRLTTMGDEVANRLSLGRPASVELWFKVNPRTHGAWALDRLAQTNTIRGRIRTCLQVAVPRPSVMQAFFPLARRGRPGLVLAYLLRPLRLAAHAGPAVRDLVRAHRAVQAERRMNGR